MELSKQEMELSKQEMELTKQEMELFLLFLTSEQKTHSPKYFAFLPWIPKPVFETGNGIIQTGNGII